MKNNSKKIYQTTILLFFLLFGLESHAAERPNIVVLLADDLGNADLGYRGSDISTPNIDALAKEGVRLEDFYGMPVCTPARAALMTGRYPMRQGLQTLVIFPSHTYGLPTDEETLAQALKNVGYQTALVGKWHLGHADKKYWPQNRGFDSFYGNLVGEVDYFTKKRGGVIDWQRNGKFLKEEGYHTDLLGNEAVRIIDDHNTANPLLLYVTFLAVHSPYQVTEKYLDLYKDKIQDPHQRSYAAMVTAMDDQVGRIVAELKKKNMFENTIFFFSSDNGGATNALFATGASSAEERAENPDALSLGQKPPASNGIFRGGKGSLYEGGVRVPTFITWVGKLKPAVIDVPMHDVDLMPTLLYLAGVKPHGKPLDGLNMWPVLTGQQKTLHDNILINVEAFRGAVRKGNWKLIKIALLPGKVELYDLSKDPGETNNVAKQNPEVVKELEELLLNYAKQQKQSEWLKAQFHFFGAQRKTILDPDYEIDNEGIPHEKSIQPKD